MIFFCATDTRKTSSNIEKNKKCVPGNTDRNVSPETQTEKRQAASVIFVMLEEH